MPNSVFKKFWNTILIVIMLYTAIFVPYRTAFIENNELPGLEQIEIAVDLLFAFDVVISLISAYEDVEGNVEAHLKAILIHYL